MFQMATGTSMVHVPYKVSANLYADLLGGTIDAIFDYTVVMRPRRQPGASSERTGRAPASPPRP